MRYFYFLFFPDKGDNKVTIEDDEYAHIMSRLDELEKEELAAEGENDSDEDEHTYTADSDNESGEDECIDIVEGDNESGEDAQINAAKRDSDGHEYNQTEANFNNFASQTSLKVRAVFMTSSKLIAVGSFLMSKYSVSTAE